MFNNLRERVARFIAPAKLPLAKPLDTQLTFLEPQIPASELPPIGATSNIPPYLKVTKSGWSLSTSILLKHFKTLDQKFRVGLYNDTLSFYATDLNLFKPIKAKSFSRNRAYFSISADIYTSLTRYTLPVEVENPELVNAFGDEYAFFVKLEKKRVEQLVLPFTKEAPQAMPEPEPIEAPEPPLLEPVPALSDLPSQQKPVPAPFIALTTVVPDLTAARTGNPHKTRPIGAYDLEFLEFWALYPRKAAKIAAYRSWRSLPNKSITLVLIKQALVWQKQSQQWQGSAQFIPHASTYLNQRRWEDEPLPAETRILIPAQPSAAPVAVPPVPLKSAIALRISHTVIYMELAQVAEHFGTDQQFRLCIFLDWIFIIPVEQRGRYFRPLEKNKNKIGGYLQVGNRMKRLLEKYELPVAISGLQPIEYPPLIPEIESQGFKIKGKMVLAIQLTKKTTQK